MYVRADNMKNTVIAKLNVDKVYQERLEVRKRENE